MAAFCADSTACFQSETIDFPLTGHTEKRYSEEQKKVINEPVKLEQNYRNFDYESPWQGTKYIKNQSNKNDKKN